ncbi:uncharacterized protein [Cherax quadricarinatus]|uniref:uncharacterized protein isoform X2 n=1 Tax=Cherax quadricarinatus TaxID=27406 RepID=UPI0023786730|nr:uncharacterized protein LOC128696925 isoform X2 [Cherax quadricarinatus]XP_053644324.1 uncharacterized protein LOC128696925 isoform X2 [Cherax quadricarinatus]XP_053644325.1 uncharacterized protein LOC128696925 isoform X2 [Cherax quadricarinatus]
MSLDPGLQTLTLSATYTFPLYRGEVNNTVNTVAISMFTVGVVLYLASLFGESSNKFGIYRRSIQEDQLDLLRQIEDNIATMGADGHACVLRFICEMQINRFSSSSIFGEIFTLIFTPKQGNDSILLKDYISAEMAGHEAGSPDEPGLTCAERYHTCPFSVFALLRRIQSGLGFSTPEDKPLKAVSNTLYTEDTEL